MVKLSINNFRAVRSASIDLNGISVLTGVNASGKSTISRLLYYSLYYSQNFEDLLEPDLLYNKLEPIISLYRRLLNSLYIRNGISLEDRARIREARDLSMSNNLNIMREAHEEIIDLLIEFYEGHGLEVRQHERSVFGGYAKKRIANRYSFINALYGLKDEVNLIFDTYNKETVLRDPKYLSRKLQREFGTPELDPALFSIQEEEESIIDLRKKSVGKVSSIDKVYYIDTPVVVNMPSGVQIFEDTPLHWAQLLELFSSTPMDYSEDYWSNRIANIVKGRAIVVKPTEGINRSVRMRFKSDKGVEFPLKEVATGIKGFAMLQLLLQKGLLDKNTLLIIDEPEAHLHPQWIVEYAKLLVELNHSLGTRFLIATHSTDMVQTLSVLKDTDALKSDLNLYLAQEAEDGNYDFINCEGDIEPIFKVFNRSLDSISQLLDAEDNEVLRGKY
ncbi:AAA family ATPase [uncultured Porphyromonas sp.]|uniref:AAA family ATPase n=1 Tax=uncultured Porphyromonas sp. TaxID=159274 RepID=UPI002598B3E6|nr:AAA family ATPase [uncultured Porphyromonas sp.]